MRVVAVVAFLLLLLLGITAAIFPGSGSIFLPGTQPNAVQTFEAHNSGGMACQNCHQTQSSGREVRITQDWQGSMMAHSARDPIFYAAVAVANKYVSGSGEFCIRCHSPSGWLEGRSTGGRGDSLRANDLNGVQCDVCHRMKDPMAADSTISPPVPGYGNGMFVVQQTRSPKRGPYTDASSAGHAVQADSFLRSGNFCGVCHNVSNPLYATNPETQSPHQYGPIERTYSEWLLSTYATRGESGTCQSCHMPRSTGYGCVLTSATQRNDLASHYLAGGNTFLPDILPDFWPGLDTTRLAAGKARARETLQNAATLHANAFRRADSVIVQVQVTNLTGHKLPTGYPEGRRMWLYLAGLNANGDIVFESGSYDFATAELTLDAQAKVYEAKPGLSPQRAAELGLSPGPSFHFILNDTIYSDNRIPPEGFSNAAFVSHMAQPVAYSYADGQNWDMTTYHLPSTTTSVSATLYYQTSSKEYITFLRNENEGNANDWKNWGDSLYAAWDRRGKSTPVVMTTTSATVVDSSLWVGEEESNFPVRVALHQNYPNPFNPTTRIPFLLTGSSMLEILLYDISGRKVATITRGRYNAGEHRIDFDATGLPSGVYFYTLRSDNGIVESRKMLLIR
jgi:hypothetical protein